MDFELSSEQKDIQRAAAEFAQGEFDPDLARELDQAGQFPEAKWKKACQLGFVGIHYPEEFGGQGLGFLENVLTIEAFCKVDSGIGSALSLVDAGSDVVMKFGSHEQKKSLLPLLAKGEKMLSFAFSESEDAKDFSVCSTVAERKGNEYLIQGTKRFVPNAALADAFVLLCKEAKEGWITLVAEKNQNFEIAPIEKMGLRMVPCGDLRLNKVRVPLTKRLGKEGEGILHAGYCHHAMGLRGLAQAVGIAQGAFDRALQHSKQRMQFGRRLSEFQVIRHKLADMAVCVEVARWLTYKSAIEYDQGGLDPRFLSMAQLEVSRKLISAVDEGLQIIGGYGYMAEQDMEHYFRDAWAVSVNLGTEEEQKDLISEKILGSFPAKK